MRQRETKATHREAPPPYVSLPPSTQADWLNSRLPLPSLPTAQLSPSFHPLAYHLSFTSILQLDTSYHLYISLFTTGRSMLDDSAVVCGGASGRRRRGGAGWRMAGCWLPPFPELVRQGVSLNFIHFFRILRDKDPFPFSLPLSLCSKGRITQNFVWLNNS